MEKKKRKRKEEEKKFLCDVTERTVSFHQLHRLLQPHLIVIICFVLVLCFVGLVSLLVLLRMGSFLHKDQRVFKIKEKKRRKRNDLGGRIKKEEEMMMKGRGDHLGEERGVEDFSRVRSWRLGMDLNEKLRKDMEPLWLVSSSSSSDE